MSKKNEEKTPERFEAFLVDYEVEKKIMEFTLQLEEDFQISSAFKGGIMWELELAELFSQSSKQSGPRDRMKKASKKDDSSGDGFKMFDLIRSVFGKDGFDELEEYYSEKNESGDIETDDLLHIIVSIANVIHPKLKADENSK